MIKLQKSSLILILIIVVLTVGCVSIYTLSYTNGAVWHKAEDVKSGTFGSNVGNGNYNFPGNVGIKKTNPTLELDVTGNIYATDQVIAGTKVIIGGSSLTGTSLTVASGGTSSIGGNLNITGNVGVGTTSPGSYKLNVNGTVNATNFYKNGVEFSGGACQLNGNDIICSGIPNNTAGTLSITKNGVTCPIWKDCDNDSCTYGKGDCDESCPTCYVGSTYYTSSPDGKDNDCDGVVDDYLSPATLSCASGTVSYPYLVVPGSSCEKVADDAYCTSVCQNNGWGKGTATCFNTWGCCDDTCATCYGATFGMGSVSCNDGRHRVSCYCASGYR